MFSVASGMLEIGEFLSELAKISHGFPIVKTNKGIEYYNIPAAFDIEVSSFYQDGTVTTEQKRAIMYIWQFGINDLVTYGRTWDEFQILLRAVRGILCISDERRLLLYVHNLAYEFQFIRKRFDWEQVFLLDERKPVYARTNGIEFRCSLKLAGGKSLANVGKDLIKYPVEKKVGDLDYEIIRTPYTPLTTTELGYCENDIRVVLSYIQEKIEQDGDVTKIPLTNTGYVRNYCRKECFKRRKKYRDIMDVLTLEPAEFRQLVRGFQGGYTHANSHYVQRVMHDVASYDFTSSYPAVMLLEKFPMSKANLVTTELSKDDFEYYIDNKCCLFDIEMYDLVPKLHQAHPLSRSKCIIAENYVLDNGRIVLAKHIKTTVTEQDYKIYRLFYDWGEFHITNFRWYEKNYLPKSFANAVLNLYQTKTRLKDVEGEEINYMISKNMANSAYGMSVTNPVRTELKYENDAYTSTPQNLEDAIDIYNKNVRRFLYYPWGVWVTAHARANLFTGILACGDDFVYSDTDSVKLINPERHKDYFNAYNKWIFEKIDQVAVARGQSSSDYTPKNKNGVAKPIGVWDFEGVYDEFKTLGAKRYLTRKGDKYSITLAGSNKKSTMEYLLKTGDPFRNFDNNLKIPPEYSGRLTLTYIDNEISGTVVDCNGVPYEYHEMSSVHMEKSEYNLTMSDDFIKFLKGELEIE